MKLKYSTRALSLYCKQTGMSLSQVAEKIGIGQSTFNRYAREERLPDINTLLRICNTLHIQVCNFFIHPDIEQTQIHIYEAEEWNDIQFRFDRIEAIRLNKQLTKGEIIGQINQYAGCKITLNTYNNLISGVQCNYPAIYGLIGSQDIELDYLFEQPMSSVDDESVLISRKKLTELKDYIAQLENNCRELECKNKRLEKKVLPRYQERMNDKDAVKIIRKFIRDIEKNYAELRSWIEEEGEKPKYIRMPYREMDEITYIVAESEVEK